MERAEKSVATKLKGLEAQVTEKDKRIEEVNKKELDLLNRERHLKNERQSIDLEVARKISQNEDNIRKETTARLGERHALEISEKDAKFEKVKKEVADLKRKTEQSAPQAHGEFLEVEVEKLIRDAFEDDEIEPVKQGRKGADILQKIMDRSGRRCGSIIWEVKHTSKWESKWVDKLKTDQRKAKADIAVIVSSVIPDGINCSGPVSEGAWVSDFRSVIGLAHALRSSLIELSKAQRSLEGKTSKMELIYKYVNSAEFKHRVEGILEPFVSMQKDMDTERRAMERAWKKREKQIERVLHNMAGMYGDLQGLGASLPQNRMLELPSGEDKE